jgi:RHS repeat-associated protein
VIYDRPIGVHRLPVRVLAGVVAAAMLVLGFLGNPPQVKAETVGWRNPATLPALATTTDKGRTAPVPLDVSLDGSFPVATSKTPTLVWRDIPAGIGQVRFTITPPTETGASELWSRTIAVDANRTARVRVADGVLRQGSTYLWQASAATDPSKTHGPFGITVDQQRANSQPLWSFGGASIAQGTGELVYVWSARSLATTGGAVGWSLVHRPTNERQQGLPTGWNLMLSGTSGWRSIEANKDGSVTLTNTTGSTVTYTRQANDQWAPIVGKFHAAGAVTLLTQNADGTFSATDGNRIVTTFSKPTPAAAGYPVQVWAIDAPTVQQTWSGGRLAGLTDPVTSNGITFMYGGNDACPTADDAGFIPTPAGDLCGVVDWAGNMIAVFYIDTPAGAQIGRIVSGYSPTLLAQASDIRWDASGRIVGLRAPFAATVAASGAIPGLHAQDERLQTRISYDDQGRVNRVTAPDSVTPQTAAKPAERPSETFSYAPFSVKAAKLTTPSGYLARSWIDPVTLRVTKQADESGNVTSFAYDAMGNRTRVTDAMTGTTTETKFDQLGRPIAQLGPTRGDINGPTAPRTTIAYDQDEQGRDWKGLGVRYWSNAGFNGAPAAGSIGPQLNGATVASLSFNWASNPTGTSGAWAARLSGLYEAPAAGAYRFETQTSAKLWINGNACTTTCAVYLSQGGAASMQIDATSADGSAAGVKVLVTGPDGKQVPVPTAQLRPNYGLPTSSTVSENNGTGQRELVTRSVFDPQTLRLVATVAPSGARQTMTYEDYDPANGHWSRPTSSTDPSGSATRLSYAAPGSVATDCAGNESSQAGALATITLPDGTNLNQVFDQGGGVSRSSDGTTTSCVGTTGSSYVQASTVQGVGPSVLRKSYAFAGGSPLHVITTTTRRDGPTETEQAFLDSNGVPVRSIDAAGASTVTHRNPYTDDVEEIVETTRDGQRRTTSFTYAPGGGVATVAVNGRVLITNTYAPDGALLRSTLANGAVQTFALDTNNHGRAATTTFPDGTVISETATHSPAGRLLARTVTGPTGSSTFSYDYNRDGRLITSRLAGTIPTRAVAWHSEYDGPAGRNGNRTSKTWELADGTKRTTDFTYGSANRLATASNGRLAGSIDYDAAGRATRVGDDTITYDAGGHVLTVGDETRTYAFTDNGQTTTFTERTGATTRSVTATIAGDSLILDQGGAIAGQVITVAKGVTALLDKDGDVTRWVYDDMLGNATWTSRDNAAPTKTHLYAPGGEPISVDRTSDPRTPADLVTDALGWQRGHGASTLRLSTPLVMIGSRSYTPDGGRWLQPDPLTNGSTNAYEYAIGDPINQVDPSGNASSGWIWGAIAATVIGAAMGAVTGGLGAVVAVQIAFGVVTGAVSGAVGEVITQLVDNGGNGDQVNWASVGIAAGIGAAAGGVSAGITGSLAKAKALKPGRNTRALAANAPDETAAAKAGGSVRRVRWADQIDDGGTQPFQGPQRAPYAREAFDIPPAGRAAVRPSTNRPNWALEKAKDRAYAGASDEELMSMFSFRSEAQLHPTRTQAWYRAEGKLVEQQFNGLSTSIWSDKATTQVFFDALDPTTKHTLMYDLGVLKRLMLVAEATKRPEDVHAAALAMKEVMNLKVFSAPPPQALDAIPGANVVWNWG